MPDYAKASILAVSDKTTGAVLFYLPSTNAPNLALNDLRAKYRAYLSGGPLREYYPSITAAGVDNLSVSVAAAAPCADKAGLNALLARVVSDAAAPPTIEGLFEAGLSSKRPVAPITLSRYKDSVRVLMKNMDTSDAAFYLDTAAVLAYLEHSKYLKETQRNFLKALCFIAPAASASHAAYSAAVSANATVCADIRSQNLKTPAMRKRWISYPDILARHAALEPGSRDYVISCFYCGLYVPPYRLLELSVLKVGGAFDAETDNYLKGGVITLNRYKTRAAFGRITQKIPAAMRDILEKYASGRSVKSDYLLCNSKGEPLSTAVVAATLTRIYGCSVDILRAAYITNLFDTGAFNTKSAMDNVARGMRHSVSTLLEYRKID